MLFNSHVFIFAFLPVTLAAFFALGAWRPAFAAGWLTLASLFFYGWWNPVYVPLLCGSIAFNFAVGALIAKSRAAGRHQLSSLWMWFGVAGNLALLGFFKYAGFLTTSANAVLGTHFDLGEIVLPLGISFFSFTQIAYLVDAARGEAREYNPVHYALFVSYFPHLIAGPLLHHREMMPQFAQAQIYRPRAEWLAVGITIFALGLFKKVVLADGIAPYTKQAFEPETPAAVDFGRAWCGALAYTFQLYFDFSAYSDMAIGLSRMFGVRMPINFNSPYKATSIIDFWRRWHMTLSRFLRNYLYIPLGGNRKGPWRRYLNLLATMLLGGLWHGANWTFVAWGGLHGLYLVVNHAWRESKRRAGIADARIWYGLLGARALTFLCVVVAWVLFRAESFEVAANVLSAMAGLSGLSLADGVMERLGPAAGWLHEHGVSAATRGKFGINWIIVLAAVAWLLPNVQQITAAYKPALDTAEIAPPRLRWFAWSPNLVWGLAVSFIAYQALAHLTRVSEFLYFQF